MPLPKGAGEVQQAVGVVMEHATVDAVTALHGYAATPTTADDRRATWSARSAPTTFLQPTTLGLTRDGSSHRR
jgi:hypothetical protein